MNYYAGIGSRSTPLEVLGLMIDYADQLARAGWCLRSGGADGADTAFETAGTTGAHQIYLPWPRFNGRSGPSCHVVGDESSLRAVAEQYHPAWHACSRGARALHTRNVAQVLGFPIGEASRFVLCWTPGGTGSGGTGQALRIAKAYRVPVFDLAVVRPTIDELLAYGR